MRDLLAVVSVGLFGAVAFADDSVPVAEITEQLTPLTAVYNGTNNYSAAAAQSHLTHLRVHKNVSTATGTEVTFDVGEGKTLVIDRLRGGRGNGSLFNKTGAGTLRIGDGAPYGGTLVMKGGTLDLSKRRIPMTAAELPDDPFLHLDVGAQNALHTVEENGRTYVNFWRNDGVGAVNGQKVVGVQASESWKHPKYFRPWLLKDALGPGRDAVDFGVWDQTAGYNPKGTYADETWPCDCGGFAFVTNENYEASAAVAPANIRTYIALVGAQRGGGQVLAAGTSAAWGSKPFERGVNWEGSRAWNAGVSHAYGFSGETITPTFYQDGLHMPSGTGFESPLYHVVAVACDPKTFKIELLGAAINGSYQFFHGGLITPEVLVYDRELTEQEILDCSAYLSWKWMGAVNPGYHDPKRQAELGCVTIAGASTIYVPAGATNRIGKLVLDAPLVKAGDGVLEAFAITGSAPVTYAGGTIFLADRPDAGDDLCRIAPGASLHLDPTQTNTVICTKPKGQDIFTIMSDSSDVAAWMAGVSYNPSWVTENTLNSLPMLDFGSSYGRFLRLSRPLDGVRSVFIVWDTRGGGGYSVGSCNSTDFYADNKNEKCFDFFRDNSPDVTHPGSNFRFVGNNGNDVLITSGNTTVLTNGVLTSLAGPNGSYQLVEIHSLAPAHVSGVKIALDRSATAGLGQVGDVLVYERELTERERVQTRNYLMKKWYNAEPVALPEKPQSQAKQYIARTVRVNGETVITEDPDRSVTFAGQGKVVKAGSGELETHTLLSFTGMVEVVRGTMKLNGVPVSHEPQMATDGQILRFDVSEGVIQSDRAANGYFLLAATNLAPVAGEVATIRRLNYPLILEDELNGLPVVDMPEGHAFQFYDANGKTTFLHDISTILWVIGSQNGGGHLMGGGTNCYTGTKYPFHRGPDKVIDGVTYSPLKPGGHIVGLTGSNAQKEFVHGSFRVNGAAQSYTLGLSGGYDLLSWRLPELDGTEYKFPMNAQGLAFDGRNDLISRGCQRLGEVLVYNRRLTSEELDGTEAYLKLKWGLCNAVPAGETSTGVQVDIGATLDLAGTTQYLAVIGGSGAVSNGCVRTAKLVYDFEQPQPLSADVFQFADSFTVEFRNVPSALEIGSIPLVTANAFVDAEKLVSATFSGEPLPSSVNARLVVRDGTLFLRISGGLMLLVR